MKSTAPRSRWRGPARLLAGLVVCYVGVVLVLMALENWLVYRPVKASESWSEPPNERVEDVELISADGVRLHAWWCPTPGWTPAQGATLYCHGNASNLSHRGESITRWQQAPLHQAVLIIDYPGYGKSEGRPSESGCCAAADAAYDWLIARAVPAEMILLYGGSLGGGVVIDLASRRPHRAVALVGTFTSLPDAAQRLYPWLPVRLVMRNRFDNLSKLAKCRRPLFIAHGSQDSLIPLSHAQRLYETAAEPKHFLPMMGLEHYHSPTPEFYQELARFLERVEK